MVLVPVFVVGVHFSFQDQSKNNANTTIISVGRRRVVPVIVGNGLAVAGARRMESTNESPLVIHRGHRKHEKHKQNSNLQHWRHATYH